MWHQIFLRTCLNCLYFLPSEYCCQAIYRTGKLDSPTDLRRTRWSLHYRSKRRSYFCTGLDVFPIKEKKNLPCYRSEGQRRGNYVWRNPTLFTGRPQLPWVTLLFGVPGPTLVIVIAISSRACASIQDRWYVDAWNGESPWDNFSIMTLSAPFSQRRTGLCEGLSLRIRKKMLEIVKISRWQNKRNVFNCPV